MRVSLGGIEIFNIMARAMVDHIPSQLFNVQTGQIPPPNCRNDNAAQRQRAAKKRRKAKGKRK